MSDIAKIDNVADLSVKKFIEQFKEQPKFEGWLRSYSNRVQELEDAIWEVVEGYYLDDAVGYQLEILGKLIGLRNRTSSVDDDFRLAIKARIIINKSQGTPEDLLSLGRLIFPENSNWIIYEKFPQGIFVEFLDDWPTNMTLEPFLVAGWFLMARAAGRELFFLFNEISADNTGETDNQGYEFAFTFGKGTETNKPQTGFGYSSLAGDDRTGGAWVAVVNPFQPVGFKPPVSTGSSFTSGFSSGFKLS